MKNLKKTYSFLLIGCFLLITNQLMAVPANPEPIQKTQSDGTVVTVRLKGDEKVHWMESLDGYTLMYNDTKDFVFAVKNIDGDLEPSTILYKGQDLNKYTVKDRQFITSLAKQQRYSAKQIDIFTKIRKITETDKPNKVSGQDKATIAAVTPVLGEKKVLCILANFANKTMIKSAAEFTNLMNQVGYTANGAKGSVKDFYRENSYGQMDITVTVAGPVTLSGNTYDYAEGGAKEYDFPKEVANLARALPNPVNFADFAIYGELPYPYNPGQYWWYVPSFHIIFAGYGDEASGTGQVIWSHQFSFAVQYGKNLYYDIKQLDGVVVGISYSCSPELQGYRGSTITSIGAACHELCHAFGSPDYYDTDYEDGGEFVGTGKWDLMASGAWNNNGITPAHVNMVQKIQFGWVTPEKLTDAKEVTNMLNSAKNPIAYTIDANEDMYVLENRQKVGFDASVPGTGLLIYHVHKDFISGNSRNINATYPQQVYPVCASGTVSIPNSSPNSYGAINSSGCPFPGTSGKTSFTDQTTPAAFYWSGSISGGGIDKPITNIKETGGVISFSFMQSTENNSIADLKNSSITAYPNPAHNQITINGLQGNGRLTVFDMVGRIRMQHNIVSSQETLSVSSLSSGNYLVQIVEGENVKYIKIIVKHTIDN